MRPDAWGLDPEARIIQNFHLFRKLVVRDLTVRFTGSALGVFWAVLQPLTLVALYWFVFTQIFTLGIRGQAGQHYVEFLIAGLIPWLGMSEGLMRSATSLVDNAPLIRKLPLSGTLVVLVPNASALIFQCVGLAVFMVVLAVRGTFPAMIWMLPIPLLLQFALQSGAGLFLAVTHGFFRDVTQIAGFALSVVFYLSPILYPVVPRFAHLFQWNPLTPLLGLYRRALLGGIPGIGSTAALPDLSSIVYLTVIAFGLCLAGSALMQRAQGDLADLI
ncbi:MAG TPA: ABC transporter permease [Thermoanaerobaculia bacterium]|nr:ABC transporter permease [Thermoanaerobaculia bacterium]